MSSAKLFYLIGASGAGKDSLLGYARTRMPADWPIAFAHRYITRRSDAGGENHVALTAQEFQLRQQRGCFAMVWHSHHMSYGIGIEIDQWLAHGLSVVVSGSRGYLAEARKRYRQMEVLLVQVAPEILRGRLEQRGRESAEEIAERVTRAREFDTALAHQPFVRIENNGPLEQAGEQLLRILRSVSE